MTGFFGLLIFNIADKATKMPEGGEAKERNSDNERIQKQKLAGGRKEVVFYCPKKGDFLWAPIVRRNSSLIVGSKNFLLSAPRLFKKKGVWAPKESRP